MELNVARQIQTVRPGSLKYAAARIGVSLPILYALIKAGKLRSYHIGEPIVFQSKASRTASRCWKARIKIGQLLRPVGVSWVSTRRMTEACEQL